ncbi:hypothetical protein V2J09_001539 [Rumex salicifolius]
MGKGRTPCCEKGRVKKGPWSQAEDLKLITFIQRHGHHNWRSLPKIAGLARCGKSCRLRWVNYLRPDLKRGSFTPVEEETIIQLQSLLGNKWSKIASHLPGRTDNEIKNVWNTHLKKRSMKTISLDVESNHTSPTSSKENGTIELSSSECSTDDCSNHENSKNTIEQIEIPYDEPNMGDLWDSLLLDVENNHAQSNPNNVCNGNEIQPFAMFEGNTQKVENSFGWQFGLLDNFEHGVIDIDSTMVGDEPRKKCEQLQGLPSHINDGLLKVDNMESYLEIMAWPTSPTYDSYLGF